MSLRKAWFTLVQVAYDLVMKLNPRKLAAHAVIQDERGRVLLLRSRYADRWMLPGGGLDRRENLDAAILRECREELGSEVVVDGLTGIYYHSHNSAYVAIFRARLVGGELRLSHEHSEYRWLEPEALPDRTRHMVEDALRYEGQPILRTFG
jgi:8-oxo-dGTP diphosphatase